MANDKRRSVFVTGTDTGVGKTLVSAALASYLSRRGVRVGVMKPLESGISLGDAELRGSDASLLKSSAQCEHSLDVICPLRFEAPLAPAIAARRLSHVIDLEMADRAFATIRATSEQVIVEGCGGIMVPVTESLDVADLAKRFDLPLMIVARAGLGTINHTGLTVNYARQKGLDLLGVILSGMDKPGDDPSHQDNAEQIEKQFDVPVLATIPKMSESMSDRDKVAAVVDVWEQEGEGLRLLSLL